MLDFIVSWTTDRSIQQRNQMHHLVDLASARRLSASEACSALPSSPIRPDRYRSGALRRVSVIVRRLAGRSEPAPASSGPALAHDHNGHDRREATTI
jgi:hypothetical protein